MTIPLTVDWVSDQDGTYVVVVDGVTVVTGSCTAGVTVENVLPEEDFIIGANVLTVTVTNVNGVGFDVLTITRDGSPPGSLCWSAPSYDDGPREELYADPLANRLSRHMRQPRRQSNVFILNSGAVVTDWIYPDDPIRVALFGAAVNQRVTAADATLLIAAGYTANLVACPPAAFAEGAGFGQGGFGQGPFGGN